MIYIFYNLIDNLSIFKYNEQLDNNSNINSDRKSRIKWIFSFFLQVKITIRKINYKENINEFLNYDYVGAPNKDWVGNGGLSLRKKSKILDILKKSKRNSNQNEDVFFTEKEHHLKIPDITTANKFSNEGIYSDESFGVHKPWWYLNEEEILPEVARLNISVCIEDMSSVADFNSLSSSPIAAW